MPVLVQSVTRALLILDSLAGNTEGLSVKDIAARVGLNVSTTHHLVNTLEDRQYVFRLANGTYGLGSAIPRLYGAFLRTAQPNARLLEIVQDLAKTTQETTYTCLWQNDEIVIQDIIEASQALRVGGLHVGFTGYPHARASGKVLLAQLSEEALDRYLATHPLTARTPNTITMREKLKAHLKLVAKQGYALDHEEFAEGVCCVAAPVYFANGQAVAALSVSVPAGRFAENEAALISAVVRAAGEASTALGFKLAAASVPGDEATKKKAPRGQRSRAK